MSNSCGRTASLRRRPDRRPACHAQAPRSSRAGAHAVIAQPDVLARGRRTYWTVKPSACARRQRSVHILRQARPCPTASTSATRSKGMQPPWGRTRGFSASELRPSRTLVPSAVPEEWPGLPGERTPEGPASVDGKSCTVDRARGKLGGLCAMRPWRTTFRPSRSPRPRGRCRHNDLLIPSSWPGPASEAPPTRCSCHDAASSGRRGGRRRQAFASEGSQSISAQAPEDLAQGAETLHCLQTRA